MHERVLNVLVKANEKTRVMGSSTACFVFLRGSTLHGCNLGDSGFLVRFFFLRFAVSLLVRRHTAASREIETTCGLCDLALDFRLLCQSSRKRLAPSLVPPPTMCRGGCSEPNKALSI